MLWICFFAVPAYVTGDFVQFCTPRPALAGTYVLCAFEPSIHIALHAAAIWQQLTLCIEIDHSVILLMFFFNRYTRFKWLHVVIDVELSLPELVGRLLCHMKISGDCQSFGLFSCVFLQHIKGACFLVVLRKFCHASSFDFALLRCLKTTI